MISDCDFDIAVNHAADIITSNEGAYGSVNKNDNGAVSVGKMQWHANRALALLKRILSADTEKAFGVLGSVLYDEIKGAASWAARIVTAPEAAALSALLNSSRGRDTQDYLAASDIGEYIRKGISYGLTDVGALIYFADGVNQYGTASAVWKNIAAKALLKGGDVGAMLAATKDQTRDYLSRRVKVHDKIVALGYGGKGGQGGGQGGGYTVRVTADVLNIRHGPGTDTAILGKIKDGGDYAIVDEAVGPGASRWGKLAMGGWIALDFTERI